VIQTLWADARIAPPGAAGGPRSGGDSTQREGEP